MMLRALLLPLLAVAALGLKPTATLQRRAERTSTEQPSAEAKISHIAATLAPSQRELEVAKARLEGADLDKLGSAMSAAAGHLAALVKAFLAAVDLVMAVVTAAPQQPAKGPQVLSEGLRALLGGGADSQQRGAARPDPIGVSVGMAAVAFAGYSIFCRRREADRIMGMFEAKTEIRELAEKAARGEKLPSVVVVRGVIHADGRDVAPVAPGVRGLQERLGVIEQPKNAWMEIAREAKKDPQLRGIAEAVAERTGDVPEPVDMYARATTTKAEGPLVLSEILIARICSKHQSRLEEKRKVLIKRPSRNESYNCFHGRRVSEGLHILDLAGSRADLVLPPTDAVGLAGIPEPPPLFLPVSDVWTEFTHHLRKDGLTGPSGRHQRLDDLPPMRLTDPYTLLSDFIFIDVQSSGDLGGMPENPNVLQDIAEACRTAAGPAKFLWEPRGFYDSVKGGGYDDVPAYASSRFRKTEMVAAGELTERAAVAARENSRSSPYCEPTFSRPELEQRRDQENCFRYTELAIPRGTPVTVLARPMVAQAGTGEGAECQIRLVAPFDEHPDDARSERFRFRILKGHTVEHLLRHRDLNVNAYYGLALLGTAFVGWAFTGYPGMSG